MDPDVRWLKAGVVDIRERLHPAPTSVVVDANVLFFVYYDFTDLAAVGGRAPQTYQNDQYPAWWKTVTNSRTSLCVAGVTLAELTNLIERAELEILWRTDPVRPVLDSENPGAPFSPRFIKTVRYHYREQLQGIREEVEAILESLKKSVNILPQIGEDETALARALKEWVASTADFGDAALVAAAKRAGMPRILSDDADLASFEGITLYTANAKAVHSAREAGKLIRYRG